MARPREMEVVSEVRFCPTHGMTEKRRHKHVVRRGKQQYLWRCVKCHQEQCLARHHAKAS